MQFQMTEGMHMSSQEIKRKLIENTKILIQKNATVTIKDIAEASFVIPKLNKVAVIEPPTDFESLY